MNLTHWYANGDGTWTRAPDPPDCQAAGCVDVTGYIPADQLSQASQAPVVQSGKSTPHVGVHSPKAVPDGTMPRVPGIGDQPSTPVARPRAARRPGSS
jgi:hypothetical protein